LINAIGIISKAGRYGGTFAHKDIALDFALWISIEFKLYIIKEFQRLKEEEQKNISWTAKRELAKLIIIFIRKPLSAILFRRNLLRSKSD
jgi:hypothetical protein